MKDMSLKDAGLLLKVVAGEIKTLLAERDARIGQLEARIVLLERQAGSIPTTTTTEHPALAADDDDLDLAKYLQ